MVTRIEIQNALNGKDDYTKLDVLNRALRNADSLDVKKFILLNLATINEARTFFKDAAKNIDSAAEMSLTFKEKMDYYMKETELLIKASDFVLADKIFLKALDCGNRVEQASMKPKYLEFYRNFADKLEKEGKSRKALEFYEKMFSMDLSYEEKSAIKEKILKIYEKVGRIRDYNSFKSREIKRPEDNVRKINPGSFEDLGIEGF
ncbi:MAG: hypothetical protein AABX03_02995 [Nanoarchaeota archaeon]